MNDTIYHGKDIPNFINKIIVIRWISSTCNYIGKVMEGEKLMIKHIIIVEDGKPKVELMRGAIYAPVDSDRAQVRFPNEKEYKLYKKIVRKKLIYNKWT